MDKKRNIAIFYENGSNISNEKMEILAFLNKHRLIQNRGNANLFETAKGDIHWISVKKRNIPKFLETYEIEEIFCIDTAYEDKELLIDGKTYWISILIEKIKDIYGGQETVFIPHYGYAKKYIHKTEMYVLDKHKECFSTQQKAEDYAVNRLKVSNEEIETKIARLQEELRRNLEYINEVETARKVNEVE
jgi:hypothetical protein